MSEITRIFAKQSNATIPVEITGAGKDYKLIEKLFMILYSKEKQL